MAVYNAAIPIIEAYMQGAQLKLKKDQLAQEKEKDKEHAQILRDQLKAQADHYKMLEEANKATNLIAQGKLKNEQLESRVKLIAQGVGQGQTYDKPTGFGPTGPAVEMGQVPQMEGADTSITTPAQDYSGVPANVRPPATPEMTTTAPELGGQPLMVRTPEMQTTQTWKPGAQIDGVPLEGLPTQQQMLQTAAEQKRVEAYGGARGIAEAQEPFKIADDDRKLKQITESARIASEKQDKQNIFAKGLAVMNFDQRAAFHAADLEYKKQRDLVTDEFKRRDLDLKHERNQTAAAKLAIAQSDGNWTDVVEGIERGEITLDQINERIPKTSDRAVAMTAIRKADPVILTKEQGSGLRALSRLKDFYESNKALAEKIKGYSKAQLLSNYNDWTKDRDIILSKLEPFARDQEYKGVITDAEQALLKKSVAGVSMTGGTDAGNDKAVENIKSIIRQNVDKQLPPSHFSTTDRRKAQRRNLITGAGLGDIIYKKVE